MSEWNTAVLEDDVLVIGGGTAAMRAALAAAQSGAKVRVVSKSKFMEGGSSATGVSELLAIGAALGYTNKNDHPRHHFEDTLKAGSGFVSAELTKILTDEAPDRINELIEWGVPFEKKDGAYLQRKSDYARYPRVFSVKGGGTAREILRVLLQRVRDYGASLEEDTMVFDLLEWDGAFAGALGVRKGTGDVVFFRAKSVILTTGAAHQLYRDSVSTADMTGDGYAIAYRLGLPLLNMEFVQIGPGIIWPKTMVLSGPVYRMNPIFRDVQGREFLQDYLPNGLTPGEVIGKKVFPYTSSNHSAYLDIAIYRKQREGPSTEHGGVYMDLRGKQDISKKIPTTFEHLQKQSVDPMSEELEVGIVMQCMNGGILMESGDASTRISGIYVAGEVAGGVRGPDRPGGNALCECQVFGNRAGKAAAGYAASAARNCPAVSIESRVAERTGLLSPDSGMDLESARATIQEIMWDCCLVIRREQGLLEGLQKLTALLDGIKQDKLYCKRADLLEGLSVLNLLDVARIVMTAALERQESRGPHFRADYPHQNDDVWKKCICITKGKNDMPEVGHIKL